MWRKIGLTGSGGTILEISWTTWEITFPAEGSSEDPSFSSTFSSVNPAEVPGRPLGIKEGSSATTGSVDAGAGRSPYWKKKRTSRTYGKEMALSLFRVLFINKEARSLNLE